MYSFRDKLMILIMIIWSYFLNVNFKAEIILIDVRRYYPEHNDELPLHAQKWEILNKNYFPNINDKLVAN